MMAGILAQHSLEPNAYSSAPAPAAPPAPTPSPQPPSSTPIAFSVVALATLFGKVGTAIGSTTLATVTCADAGMTAFVSENVPGLAFSYVGGVLSVSGTPTAPAGVHRVVVSYVASDGSNSVRGSSEHEITIVDLTTAFTVGSCASLSARIGETVDVLLCSPTTAQNVDVAASGDLAVMVEGTDGAVDGLALTWTPGATSSGELRVTGVIADQTTGTYTLTVRYLTKGNTQVELGTSSHTVIIEPRYVAPTPAPAPAPAPPPPSPAPPPPAPAPAPQPGVGPDAYFSGVKVLMHFDAATGLNTDVKGNTFESSGVLQDVGAVGEAAVFSTAGGVSSLSAVKMTGPVDGIDGKNGVLYVECMVDIEATAWDALMASGSAIRYCPVATLLNSAGSIVWTLGFISYLFSDGSGVPPGGTRWVQPAFIHVPSDLGSDSWFQLGFTSVLQARPDRFVHLCGGRKPISATQFLEAAWFDGQAPVGALTGDLAYLRDAPTGTTLQIGGAIPRFLALWDTGKSVQIVPFAGSVDDLRASVLGRYDTYLTSTPTDIPAAGRVIPWPNY